MTYHKAIEFLFSRHQKGTKLSLEKIQILLDRLNHPEKEFKSIHIAGTNGKGSTAAILESVLREAGYCTGLYTSPHLIDMRERIRIRGKMISEGDVVKYIKFLKPHIDVTEASFFEILTAIAFLYFKENQVELAILETGLGGRLDATNTIIPELSIITDIGLDHTKILGKTLLPIAREKAGILKKNIPCILGIRNPSVKNFFIHFAQKQAVPCFFTNELVQIKNVQIDEYQSRFHLYSKTFSYPDLLLNLVGMHQILNCATSILALEQLKLKGWNIPEGAIRKGLKKVVWHARLELLQKNPKILLDSAHNPFGMRRLVHALKTVFQYHHLILIFGVLKDKDYQSMVTRIAPLCHRVILSRPLNDRALNPEELLKLSAFSNLQAEVISDIEGAWKRALNCAEKDDLICGTGSIYFVGELLRLWQMENRKRLSSIS